MPSFKDMLSSRYGAATRNIFCDLTKCASKLARISNHLNFNQSCRDFGLVPVWAKIRNPLPFFWKSRSTCAQTSKQFVVQAITMFRKEHRLLKEKYDHLSNQLQHLEPGTLETCFCLVTNTFNRAHDSLMHTQTRKLNLLMEQQVYKNNDPFANVINISKYPLSRFEAHVLNLGLHFNVSSPVKLFPLITTLEYAAQYLPFSERNSFRSDCAAKLSSRSNKPHRPHNLTIAEDRALKKLKNQQQIMILPADKGHKIVVMDKVAYKEKMSELLCNPVYNELPSSPFSQLESKVAKTVKAILKSGHISKRTANFLCSNEGRVPQLYGLPKIHKPNIPLRPIISQCGTPAYNIAKFLCPIISPLLSGSDHIMKDSFAMADFLKSTTVPLDYLMVSFDVKNLFTCTPVEATLNVLHTLLQTDNTLSSRTALTIDEIVKLTKTAVDGNSFQYENRFFTQTDGLAMGSPLSPVLSNLFMMDFENKLLSSLPMHMPPIVWKRYVDDVFVLCHKDFIDELYTLANSIDPIIQFTIEREKSNQLPFLDILIYRNQHKFDLTIYRKPFSANQLLHFRSSHHRNTKFNLVQTLTHRILRICSPQMVQPELNRLLFSFEQRGYPTNFVKQAINKQLQNFNANNPPNPAIKIHDPITTISLPYHPGLSEGLQKVTANYKIRSTFRANNKVIHFFPPKVQPIPTLQTKNVVYKIMCSCGEAYIGETKRQLSTRVNEHKKAFINHNLAASALASHAQVCMMANPQPRWEDVQVVANCKGTTSRKLREALEINRLNPRINRDRGIDVAAPWRSLLRDSSS